MENTILQEIKMIKKIVPMILTLALALSLVSCDKSKKEPTPTTPAQILCAEFKNAVKKDSSINLEDLGNQLITNEIIEFGGITVPIEEGYLMGFTKDVTGFKSGVFFGPMIGAIPFVGYLFEVDGDTNAFIKNLEETADLRWNVCTSADEKVSAAVGNKVFFVMAPKSFDENEDGDIF